VAALAVIFLAGISAASVWLSSNQMRAGQIPQNGSGVPSAGSPDDLHGSWERAEKQLNAGEVSGINSNAPEAKELNVSATFFDDRQRKALEDRPGEKGSGPQGSMCRWNSMATGSQNKSQR
jgi:hypothetical protein